MKTLLFAVAGLGVGGAAYLSTDDADFDRVVDRPAAEVYAAFSALAPEGSITAPPNDAVDRTVTMRVAKERDAALRYEILFDERPVATVDLTFEPAGPDGRQTRMTAELDLDEYELGSAFETEAGVALSMVPEAYVDMQFANFIGDMVADVEAGRSLPPLSMDSAGVRPQNANADVRQRRSEAEAARRAAARPTVRPVPMVDPNRAAEAYRNGQTAPPGTPGGWGR